MKDQPTVHWYDDLFFRALIGPATVKGAIQGGGADTRAAWKTDLAHRKEFSAKRRTERAAARELEDEATAPLS